MQHFTFLLLMIFTSLSYSAGGSSVSGGSGSFSQPTAKKTPRELAVINYNQGLKYRDKAEDYREQASEQTVEKKRVKLNKKSNRQFEKAVKKFRTAIKHEPSLHQAHGSLGYALKELKQFEDALVAYDKSIELKADYSPAIEYRAETHLALGKLDETKEAYIELLTLDRPRADLLMNAIEIWLKQAHSNVEATQVAEFQSWATERLTLSANSMDLTGAASTSWQPIPE
jgi:tetratricopeptide (TPR) repeat protein